MQLIAREAITNNCLFPNSMEIHVNTEIETELGAVVVNWSVPCHLLWRSKFKSIFYKKMFYNRERGQKWSILELELGLSEFLAALWHLRLEYPSLSLFRILRSIRWHQNAAIASFPAHSVLTFCPVPCYIKTAGFDPPTLYKWDWPCSRRPLKFRRIFQRNIFRPMRERPFKVRLH